MSDLKSAIAELRVSDDYLDRLHGYLTFAASQDLESDLVAHSCIDLAETYTTIPELAEKRSVKLNAWNTARQKSLAIIRQPRQATMELDPLYFYLINSGRCIQN